MSAEHRRNAALLRYSSDLFVVFSDDLTVKYVSPAITELFGWSADEFVGSKPVALMPEEERDLIVNAHRAAMADPAEPQEFEAAIPHISGSHRWMKVTVQSLLEDPDVLGVVAIFHDLSKQLELMEELADRNTVLENIAFSSSTGLFEEDSLHGLTYSNDRFSEITGLSRSQAMGFGWKSLAIGELPFVPLSEAKPGYQRRKRFRFKRADGAIRWVDARATVSDASGVRRRMGGIEDVTDEVDAEDARQRFIEVVDDTDDLVILVAGDGDVIYANQALRDTFGGDLHNLVDVPALMPVSDGVIESLIDGGQRRWNGEVTILDVHGNEIPMSLKVLAHRDSDGEISFFSAVARDISERIELEATLERQARHDPLTGLPNRVLLFERLTEACTAAQEAAKTSGPQRQIAVLFVDIDHFKLINDSLGHSFGDELLREIARRIQESVESEDTVCRFGGDEFVVLCDSAEAESDPVSVARRIESKLQLPFEVGGQELHIGVSTGIAYADHGGNDALAVLRDADTAMYEAKSTGRGRWVVFDDRLRRRAVGLQRTETALRRSRNGEGLELEYQPVVELDSRRILGFEALLRWRVQGELVPPEDFVPLAEETGLIVPIGNWVMENALRQIAQWQEIPGYGELGVAVNVSARQLQHPDFLAMIGDILTRCRTSAGTLTIEITESVVLQDITRVAAVLEALRAMSVEIAVDDFGTGYSSLTYLHKLPLDIVKLDQSFVAGVADSNEKRAIVTAVLNLAEALGLRSIAEGVETDVQLAELRQLGCTYGQGHLLSEPLGPVQMTERLTDVWIL